MTLAPPSSTRGRRVALWLAVLIVGALALAWHASRFIPFLCDDALISLRYARRLIEGQGLTWNAGERVEGYSNLLWVLAAAALGRLGLDLVTAVRVLGAAGMIAALAAVGYAAAPATLGALPVAGIAVLFLSLSSAFAVWTIGGMEQPLVAALLAWGVVLCYPRLEVERVPFRSMQAPALCFALLCLTRPDSPLFTAAAALAFVVTGGLRRAAFAKAIALVVLPLAFYAGQLVFRLAYYGEWVPNTALVKFAPTGYYARDGWRYVSQGALAISPLLALALASAVVSFACRFQRARMTLLCLLAAAWTGYVIFIGGDIFPAWRHFVPLLVLLALMVVIGGEWVRLHARRAVYAGTVAASLVLLGGFLAVQWRDVSTGWALTERWEWDGQVIGTILKRAMGPERPLLAVDAAGALPYWSELPSLDMLGLNDYYLPRHPPTDHKTIGIGHDLGDGQYVLRRDPDLVVFGIATGGETPFFRSARELVADPRFGREYVLMTLEATQPYPVTAKIWVKRRSARIGVRTRDGVIVVPGFLMDAASGAVTRVAGNGALVRRISSSAPARLEGLEVPSGRWAVEAQVTGAPINVSIWETSAGGGRTPLVLDAPLPTTLGLDGAGPHRVTIEVAPGGSGEADLAQVTLRRSPG